MAAVLRRADLGVAPVGVYVVDNGSDDETARRAAEAGAIVVRQAPMGLGAAVRTGLREAVDLGAVAVAFCDADGEYAPEELDRLVTPILAGDADYVIGSRFRGEIGRMRPHRRAGNKLLTKGLAYLARRDISDGQSGYRAFSADAARRAEVIHDYNYAQVLTLDLVQKGYRYAEVPISYSFRESGRSFVKLGPYLAHVLPAVWRELRQVDAAPRVDTTTPELSVLDNV
jgi:glycosyltransferase involved in cell wall biosynthesis